MFLRRKSRHGTLIKVSIYIYSSLYSFQPDSLINERDWVAKNVTINLNWTLVYISGVNGLSV